MLLDKILPAVQKVTFLEQDSPPVQQMIVLVQDSPASATIDFLTARLSRWANN